MHFRGIVSPQLFISETIGAVEVTTSFRSETVIDGGKLDHYGFVVSPADYDELREEFVATYLAEATEVALPSGGRVTMGPQVQPADIYHNHYLDWFWGNPLPALALVADDSLELPAGGGYIAARVPDLAVSSEWNHLEEWKVTKLYGRVALRLGVGAPMSDPWPGVHALYVVDAPLSEVITTITS